MIGVRQTILTGPVSALDVSEFGDCYRTAIACVLELPARAVPHFATLHGPHDPDGGPIWWDAARRWLRATHRLDTVHVVAEDFPTPRSALITEGEPAYALATGKSPRGEYSHVVVADLDGRIVWDPHPSDAGLDGPVQGWDLFVTPYEPGPGR